MDRSVFLRALTFLEESPSASWPPAEQEGSPQVLLRDHVVSMEPTSVDNRNQSLGPAFFGSNDKKNDEDFDPSICPISIALVRDAGKKTSSASSTTLGSHSPRTPTKQQLSVDLYFRVDKQWVFRVDTTRLHHVEVLPGVVRTDATSDDATRNKGSSKANEDDNTQKSKYLPPCLMLYFDCCCCFRIFSMEACNENNTTRAQQVLEEAWTKLQQALRPADETVSALTTPGSSSGPSSLEQKRQALFDLNTLNDASPRKPPLEDERNETVTQLKRRHASLTKSWKGIQSLEQQLTMPGSSLAKSLQEGHSLQDALGPLLTTTAQDFVSSRRLPTEGQARMDDDQHNVALERVLDGAFPPPFKQRRRGLTPPTQNMSDISTTNLQELKEKARQIVLAQRQAIEKRHFAALLP